MGKIGYSSVTLTDLTETLPVTLVLETSLDQNIQTKVGSLYTPNFKEEELIITPSLFLGQEDLEIHKNEIFVVPNERQDGYIYYQIGDIENNKEINYYYGSTAEGSEVWVDKQGKLHIKRNLTKNLTVEANITNFYLPEHDYHVPQVSEVTPLNILLLEAGSSEYSAIITSSGREYFDEGNTEAITLTALLYKGATPLESGVSYKWDIMTDKDTPDTEEDDGGFNSPDFVSREQSITVTRDKVHNTEIFICNMSLTDGSGLTFTANKILRDFSDEYSNNLFASSSTILNPKKLSVEITNQVRWQTEIINGEAANQNRFKYEWSILPKEGEQIDLVGDVYKNKTIEIVAGNSVFPKEDFTILGKVTIDNKVISFSYINIIYRETIYTVELSPKTFFIPVDSTGKITAPFSKEFSFKLLDENKKPIPFEVGDDKISLNKKNEDTTSISLIEGSNSFWEDSYLFNLDINYINNNFLERDDPLPYEFSYQYLGQNFQEEINIVKVFKGPQGIQGSQGFSGYTVDLSNEFHAFSGGEGHADPNQSTSCKISAYFGDEGRIIQSIKLGSQTIYQLNTTPSLVTYSSSEYGYLYIQARKEQDHIIELTIRTNNSTTEAGKFLKGIRPLSFDVTILNTKNENLVFPKVFTYTINYNGKSYSLIPSHNFIKYSEAEGTYEPSKITASATMRQESGEAVTYSGAKIIYSFDGDNWKNYTTSGISGFTNLQNIYLRLYSSQATFSSNPTSEISNNAKYLLDMETIPVLTSLEGYEIGGENLLRWTKDLPIENNKWSRNDNSNSYLTIEKDGDFSVLNYNVKDDVEWRNFKSPRTTLESEYIGKNFCFSCFIYSDNWSSMTSTFHLGISAYKDIFRVGRDAYKNVGLFNNRGESSSNPIHYEGTWENGKWIKIWTTFSFDNLTSTDFDTNGDGEKNQNDVADPPFPHSDYKYFSFDLFLHTQGQLKIKKPKLELGKIPTAWSPSPYDIDYTNIAGTNLIDDAKPVLTFSDSYQLNSSLFSKDNLYTLSWSQVSYSGSKPTLTWKINNSSTNTGSFSLINNFQYTFPKQSADWYLTLFISEGEITFNELKIEKGTIATGYKITVEQANAIAEEQAKNAALAEAEAVKKAAENDLKYQIEELYKIPTIGGGYEAFSTKEAFIAAIQKYNEYDGRINTVAGDLEAQDTDILYSKEGIQRLEKSIQVVTSTTEPYIKIQADLQSESSSKTNFLKLTPERLEFWSGTASNQDVVAYMSNNLLVIKRGQLDEAIVKNYFNIGGLNFKITESGVGVIWDFNFNYSE